jgi:hypothetical protein
VDDRVQTGYDAFGEREFRAGRAGESESTLARSSGRRTTTHRGSSLTTTLSRKTGLIDSTRRHARPRSDPTRGLSGAARTSRGAAAFSLTSWIFDG